MHSHKMKRSAFAAAMLAVVVDAASPSQIATGLDHSCEIHNGAIECWGSNERGQAPESVKPTDGSSKFLSVTASWDYTCGVTAGGKLECFGENQEGEAPSTPTRATDKSAFVACSAGGYHTCCLTSNGAIDCFGDDWAGQAGLDKKPKSGTTFTAVCAGGYHTCGLTSSGQAQCCQCFQARRHTHHVLPQRTALRLVMLDYQTTARAFM